MSSDENIVKGRGAQINSQNPFLKDELGVFDEDGIDDLNDPNAKTTYLKENPRKIVNKVYSPDLGFEYSMNPYQGCEHGCVYCYARNTHHYWGYSAGLDFEQKIIIKENAAKTLEKQFRNPNWKVSPIMLAGNTDCYQPAERKLKITRSILEVMLKHRHPVGLITKNELVTRDADLLADLAKDNLVNVAVSINSLNENVRRKLEPRTTTYKARIKAIENLAKKDIPVNVMIAPVIPGLTSSEIPDIIKTASHAGANSAAYIIVRLNGAVGGIFIDWVKKQFPDRADKILNQVADCHGGKINDSRFGTRMRGEGKVADSIRQIFHIARNRWMGERKIQALNTSSFIRGNSNQLSLF